jgi:hypothetical protein
MKYILIFLAMPFLSKSGCQSKKIETPACIQQRIDQIKSQPRWNPPAEVIEYIYQGKRVFLFSSPCCDQFNTVYDENCKAVCAPSGGYSGKGDGKCPDFNANAKLVRQIWKDERP